MKKIICMLAFALLLGACQNVDLKAQPNLDAAYLENRSDIANMSEYDKQRYYNQHHLGVVGQDDRQQPKKRDKTK